MRTEAVRKGRKAALQSGHKPAHQLPVELPLATHIKCHLSRRPTALCEALPSGGEAFTVLRQFSLHVKYLLSGQLLGLGWRHEYLARLSTWI